MDFLNPRSSYRDPPLPIDIAMKRTIAQAMPPYETRSDVGSQIIEFLNDLRADDIITELVQNDLDQRATHTRITIREDSLVAEGNGKPVDETGWRRLTYMLGAGVEVPAKKDGIGVKNHGLRACFSLGDLIIVQSAGRQTRLTLRKNGARAGLAPGALKHPMADSSAPLRGCRIEVPFRTIPLRIPGGEAVDLPVPGQSEIEQMFLETCGQAPMRLLGCFRPGYITNYVLELIHWKLGRYTYTYSVTPLRSRGRLSLHRRRCSAATPESTEVYQEDAFLYLPTEALHLGRRVSAFYRHRSRQVVEVSWSVNDRGVPRPSSGHFRYPIGYTGDAENARTSIGANISAPFVSETVRHGLAAASQTHNDRLVAAGEAALIRVLREHLVPKYGPAALVILEDPERPRSPRMERLVAGAARAGALPAATTPERKERRRPGMFPCVPQEKEDAWSFVVPAFSWMRRKTAPILAEIAPQCPQIHPSCPEHVLTVLLDQAYRADRLPYTSFDESDAIARLLFLDSGCFPWRSREEWKAEIGVPGRVRKYLDIIAYTIQQGRLRDDQTDAIRAGCLPDEDGEPIPLGKLYRARTAIEPIPGVRTPSRVHPELADHRLLREGRFKLKQFVLDEYVSNLDFKPTGAATRQEFFTWLTRNHRVLQGSTLKQIAQYPVWRTTADEFVTFESLCAPDRRFQRVLSGHIREPAPGVLTIKRIRRDGHGLLRLRKLPNEAELRSWYLAAAASLPQDRPLSPDERKALRGFEGNLMALRRHSEIRSRLTGIDSTHLGLSRSGMLRPLAELHLETDAVTHCALLPDDLAAADAHLELYRELGARTRPSARAIIRALREDPEVKDALHPRLAAYVAAVESGEPAVPEIGQLPFLWVDGQRHAPESTALRSSRDYWGRWKVGIDADGLAAERQANLRFVGVTPRRPTEETSRYFFEWLSRQDESVVRGHLDQVIRHFLYPTGPLRWWRSVPNLPCLPVFIREQVRLVSRKSAFSSNPVLLPDFPELEQQILAQDRRRRIAIVDTTRVQDSILDALQREGLRTVRQTVVPPICVTGEGPSSVAEELRGHLTRLTSPRLAGELRKRLQEQQVPGNYLKKQWRQEVRSITEVRYARSVIAEFETGANRYRLQVSSGIDQASGVLWVAASIQDPVSAVFAAVAERVFYADAPAYFALALRTAVEKDFASRFRSEQLDLEDVEESEAADDETGEEQPAEAAARSRDTRPTHPSRRAEEDHAPEPEPFTPEETRPSPQTPSAEDQGQAKLSTARKTHSPRSEDPVERAAIQKLKSRHYAWHCQACLAESDPAMLAPAGSYASRARHRRTFMQAHHVDPVHGEGARAIGNIILLCRHHHDLLGDKLERRIIRTQLLEHAAPQEVQFPGGDGREPKRVRGVQVTVQLDTEPWEASFFFTNEHARVWSTSEV